MAVCVKADSRSTKEEPCPKQYYVGEIANPTRELQVLWWMAPNNSIHFENAVLVGHGMSPRVPTDLLDPSRGDILALEVKDLDPLALAMDADGKVFVDADGNPFIFH